MAQGQFSAFDSASLNQSLPHPSSTYDVVIYGATVAGVGAAYAARLMGKKVLLIQHDWFGGMTGAGGLTNLDLYYPNVQGGNWWQMFQRMALIEGVATPGWPTKSGASSIPGHPGYVNPTIPGQLTPQPKTALAVLELFFNASGADLLVAPLETMAGSVAPSVLTLGYKITSLITTKGTVNGSVFIDASYEGDVMYGAGVPYTIGRESSAQYGESLAGVHKAAPNGSLVGLLVDGNNNPLFPLIPNTSVSAGSADKNIQPYSFRPSIQLISNGGKAFARPTSYDRSKYTLIANYLTAKQKAHFTDAVTLYTILGNKYNYNDKGLAMSNQSAAWPDATPTQRQVIYDAHKNFSQGLFYFLTNDAAVPAAVRSNTALYGLSSDEFVTTNNWPPQMYIREARRMLGDFVLTQANIPAGSRVSHPICMASYVLDCHAPAVYLGDKTHYIADGSFYDTSVGPFQLPMECIVPPMGGVTNLLVPVCISASHIAYAPIRMEPSFCMMGEAAGLMAALMVNQNRTAQRVQYADLQPLLNAINARIS